jgi:hypothetical protein
MADREKKKGVKYEGIDIETRKIILTLTEPLLGTASKNEKIYTEYILSKAPDPTDEDAMEELETIPRAEDELEKNSTGFHRDVEGIYILDYQVKGFLKHAGNVLKDAIGVKALRSKLNDFVFIEPRYIYLADEPDGVFERPLRANTMQGPRVCLARSEYVEAGKEITIKITLFPHKELSWDLIETLLDYGRFMGLGQFRNGSYGRFEWRYADAELERQRQKRIRQKAEAAA